MARFAKRAPHAASAVPSSDVTCAYEAERAARIASNKARMMRLGLLDASAALSQAATVARVAARHARQRRAASPLASAPRRAAPRLPPRRSGRLTGAAPTASLEDESWRAPAAPDDDARAIETYTAEHRAALGTSRTPWVLFVDGYDASGARIYDAQRGATCHQCRQKTVCKHTSCGGCGELRGQFCGDCLWMRYGENVDEAVAAGDAWRCPPCRDLCNCSFCRQRKGWPPTGTMYRRAIREGFESVAHYLVLGADAPRAGTEEEEAEKKEEKKEEKEAEKEEEKEEGTTDAPADAPATPPLQRTRGAKTYPWESARRVRARGEAR